MKAGPAIDAEVVAPASAAAAVSKSNAPIPLIVKASDTDELIQRCSCILDRRRIGIGEKTIAVLDSVRYRWTVLEGQGRLHGTGGPATLFQPPPIEVGSTALVTLKALIDNSSPGGPNGDEPVEITFAVLVRRRKEHEYERTITIERDALLPGVMVTVAGRPPNCLPRSEVWERYSARLQGQAAVRTVRVRAGERVLLFATAADSDSLRLSCAGDCGASRLRVNVTDAPRYTWSARRGGFPDHGAEAVTNGHETSAIYIAPEQGGSDTVTIRIGDSQEAAADDSLEEKIEIHVYELERKPLQPGNSDPEFPGGMHQRRRR